MTYISPSGLTWSFDFETASDTANMRYFDPSSNLTSAAGIKYPLMGFARFPQISNTDPTFQSVGALDLIGPITVTECALYFCIKSYSIKFDESSPDIRILSTYHDPEGLEDDSSGSKTRSLSLPTSQASNFNASAYSFNPEILQAYFQNQLNSTNGKPTDLLSQLSWTTNVTQMVTNIGLSMTAALMNNGTDEQFGAAYSNKAFIHVRWPWLLFPAGLVLFTTIIFFLVMAKTAQKNMIVWKSSVLALIFHASGLQHKNDITATKVTQMESRAKNLKVELLGPHDGWKFVRR